MLQYKIYTKTLHYIIYKKHNNPMDAPNKSPKKIFLSLQLFSTAPSNPMHNKNNITARN